MKKPPDCDLCKLRNEDDIAYGFIRITIAVNGMRSAFWVCERCGGWVDTRKPDPITIKELIQEVFAKTEEMREGKP